MLFDISTAKMHSSHHKISFLELFPFLFDISTATMHSSHHQINFLEFSKFSEELQIYLTTLAFQNII